MRAYIVEYIKLLLSFFRISLSVVNMTLLCSYKTREKLHKKQINVTTQLFVFLLISNIEQAISRRLINGSEMKPALLEI